MRWDARSPSPWYFPGRQALALLAWAYLLQACWVARPRAPWAAGWPPAVTRIAATLFVLRQGEAVRLYADTPALRARHQFVRAFDARAAVDASPLLPGRGYLEFDALFLVYRRGP